MLFDCFSPMVVFVETLDSSGSGIILDTGHVVTNAHVVDPYEFVTVTLSDGTVFGDVEVLGVEFAADVALLGPIDTELAGLAFSEEEVDQGQELVLVGYPLTGAEPVPTVVSGILSRQRSLPAFDLTILQIDAAVAPGDSGGLVLTRTGSAVGVTTGIFGSAALAASAQDVVVAGAGREQGGPHNGGGGARGRAGGGWGGGGYAQATPPRGERRRRPPPGRGEGGAGGAPAARRPPRP
ncbi:MAG: serine protease, partial [Actinomycetota bacterium]